MKIGQKVYIPYYDQIGTVEYVGKDGRIKYVRLTSGEIVNTLGMIVQALTLIRQIIQSIKSWWS